MNQRYNYEVEGSAADGQTWKLTGQVYCEFHEAFDKGMRQAFQDLTQGKAQYGKPGVGCKGPYRIRKFMMEAADGIGKEY